MKVASVGKELKNRMLRCLAFKSLMRSSPPAAKAIKVNARACFKFPRKYVYTFCMEGWKNGKPDPSFFPFSSLLPQTKSVKRFLKHAS